MTVEVLQRSSVACYIAAGILLLVGVALFFLLDVPRLYSDISGRTARKAIEAFHQHNEYTTGNMTNKSGPFHVTRTTLTDKIAMLSAGVPRTSGLPNHAQTEKEASSEPLAQSNESPALCAGNETTLLSTDNETAILTANETTVLAGNRAGNGQTANLLQQKAAAEPSPAINEFSVDVEIAFTESSEIIA